MSKGKDQQLEAAGTSQGGGKITSSRFQQQGTIGEAIAGSRLSSTRFRVIPGFIGAALSSVPATSVSDLDMTVLYARTDPLGVTIVPQTWQGDNDPVFLWEPPALGLDVAGYSYALDENPDDVVDTAATSFNVATSTLKTLADGKHVFTVKAINTAGNTGKAIAFELWVDTTTPQIVAYGPSPGSLLNTLTPSVSATVSDVGSGVKQSTVTLLINGSAVSIFFNEAAGVVTNMGGTWKEGANSLELRVADAVGNVQAPLVWSVTVDTQPPTGSVILNGGAAMTTSVYVTLGLGASDATSGVARMLISNQELTGYVEEPYGVLRELWRLNPVRGMQTVYVKFIDNAGNVSAPVSDDIDLGLLSPETVITSGPAGFAPDRSVSFTFMCPETDCLFAFAFDMDEWSEWSPATSAAKADLIFGNHYFRVKAAREVNGVPGIQPDEEDPSPAERMWIIGVEPSVLTVPKGPPIKLWRLE